MDVPGTRLTLVRAFRRGPDCYRLLAAPPDMTAPAGATPLPVIEMGELRLNRQITLPNGEGYRITRRGSLFAVERALWRGAPAVDGESPLALLSHERRGLRWRYRVTLAAPERWLWLRQRGWLSSPANRDVVAVAVGAEPSAADPVLLRVERRGGWRRHLQAEWLAPAELPLPVVVFVLGALVEMDRRAAAAVSASAGGV